MDERIRALTIGAPAYALRKRKIEDDEASMIETLVLLHASLFAKGRSPDTVRAALLAKAQSFDLAKLNALILTHNRYYPIEANLKMDRHGYLVFGKRWAPEEPWTVERLLARAEEAISRKL